MTKRFRRATDLPTWRRIALNAWAAPRESTIHGSIEVDATEALSVIGRYRDEGVRVTITHLVAKAVALALAKMPEANGFASRGTLWLRGSVDIFLQVSLDGGQSLSGATIRDADRKSVPEIASELAAKVDDIRSHRDSSTEKTTQTMSRIPSRLLGPLMRFLSWLQYDHDWDLSKLGIEKDMFGSAMVTNVGMFGLQQGFAPVFPLGRTALVILVGEVTPKPVAIEGRVEVRPMLGLHATIDHRVIDGYHAGILASHVREALSNPESYLA